MPQSLDLPLHDFANIQLLLRHRHFSEALRVSKTVLKQYPKLAEAHYLVGLSALSLKQVDESLEALQKAAALAPEIPHYHCNLGNAYRGAGQLSAAIQCFQNALRLKPDYEIARYNLGSALFAQEDYQQALGIFQSLVRDFPTHSKYWVAQGDAHRELKRFSQAILSYRHALKLDPENFAGQYNLGRLLLEKADFENALVHCQKAVELQPRNGEAHQNLGQCWVGLEELDNAMNAYADALELTPESGSLMTQIARVWLDVADYVQAAHWFGKTLEIEPDNLKARIGLAAIKRKNEQTEAALEDLQKLLGQHPNQIEVLKELGQAAWDNGDADDAVAYLRQVEDILPETPPSIHAQIGGILSSSGDVEGAIAEYNRALEQNPRFIPALNGLASTLRGRLEPEKVELMHSLLQNPKLREGARASLHNALAYYYDGVKQFDKVPEHAAQANRLYWIHRGKCGWEYDPANYERFIDKTITHFDKTYFERIRGFGLPDETPVFIVGMPRSGTTLTEQILSTHTRVLGIGERTFANRSFMELPLFLQKDAEPHALLAELDKDTVQTIARHYLSKLNHLQRKHAAEDTARVVDKMPDNYSQLGWIVTLFPNAKIIHCRRDVRDIALSCWLTQFGAIRWACDLEHIARRIEQYQRIMAHWRAVLPIPILELDYEQLVANQEQESRRLLNWIGLEWDERCLKFYDNQRLVRTASVTQVRQPIYKRSVARWKPYEEMLAPIIQRQANIS